MDVDCHPCASKQEQIVKFACGEQGLGRAGERSKRSSWCKGRSGVRGRFATERRTVNSRYFASSCEKVSTKNSICGSTLGTFRFSRSKVFCRPRVGTPELRCGVRRHILSCINEAHQKSDRRAWHGGCFAREQCLRTHVCRRSHVWLGGRGDRPAFPIGRNRIFLYVDSHRDRDKVSLPKHRDITPLALYNS